MNAYPHEILETMQKGMIQHIPAELRKKVERDAQIRYQRRLFRRLRNDPRWDENTLYELVSSAGICAFDK